MNKKTVFFICLGIILLPVIYLATIWNGLPQTIPAHWGTGSQPDRYGDKSELLILPLVMGLVSLGTTLLLLNIDKLDPKRGKEIPFSLLTKICIGLSIFFAALLGYIMYVTQSKTHEMGNFLFVLVGLLISFLGNLMYNIKQNFFIGVRLPWTLTDEDNWKSSNRLLSILFFISGILIVISALTMSYLITFIITISSVIGSALYVGIYSYKMFKRKQLQ